LPPFRSRLSWASVQAVEGKLLSVVLSWIVALIVLSAALYVGYFAYATRRIAAEAEKAVPPSGKFVDIDGNRIHYAEAGEGRPILFIHGLGAQFHQFEHPLFNRLEGELPLVALDRPGSGYSVGAPRERRGQRAGARDRSLHGQGRPGKAARRRPFAGRHHLARHCHRAPRQDFRTGAAFAVYALQRED
jgi:hypothetical protein